jgi:uncharacterized oxidoreductase
LRTKGNTVLITGGTSGLGLGFAEEFIRRGNKVIISGRREKRLQDIKKKNEKIEIFVSDVSFAEQRQKLFETVTDKFPETNILINNAGVQLLADLTRINLDKVNKEVETNFVAPIHLCSLFAEHLKSKKESAIINISSGLAFVPLAFVPVYCATKAAIHSYTMSLRFQLRNTSVKVFEIIPPSVDTELGQERRADKNQTHGGLPIPDFITEAMDAVDNDHLEAAVADAKNLREKGETLFPLMNK